MRTQWEILVHKANDDKDNTLGTNVTLGHTRETETRLNTCEYREYALHSVNIVCIPYFHRDNKVTT